MRQFHKLLALSKLDKELLLRCAAIVAATRLALCVVSYRTLRRWMPADVQAKPVSTDELCRIAWGIRTAARVVPGATCLTQALAAQFLLAWSGQSSHIRIGVTKDANGQFCAHAWLISSGRVLIGGSSMDFRRYTPLVDLDIHPL